MTFRKYLSWTAFIVLLVFGPIDKSWTVPFLIRISYLILIPTFVWLILGWLWEYFQIDFRTDEILSRILSSTIAIGIFFLAYFEATSKNHLENSNYTVSRDEIEPIGQDFVVNGPNWGNVLFLIIFAIAVFYYGVIKIYSKNKNEIE
jgi:ABC-type uncharacterized transport system permease subunit